MPYNPTAINWLSPSEEISELWAPLIPLQMLSKYSFYSFTYHYHSVNVINLVIRRTSRSRLLVSAKASAKFLGLIGFRKSFLLFTIRKRRSVAFQPLGGVPWFDLVEIYSQSFPQKTITMTMTMTPLNSTSEKMSCVFTSSKQHCSSPLKFLPYNSVGQLRFY